MEEDSCQLPIRISAVVGSGVFSGFFSQDVRVNKRVNRLRSINFVFIRVRLIWFYIAFRRFSKFNNGSMTFKTPGLFVKEYPGIYEIAHMKIYFLC